MRIHFEFLGGPNDGRVFHGTLGDVENPSDAERYYLLSHHGAVGQRFKIASPYAVETLASEQLKEEKPHKFQQHFYVVTNRIELEDEVWIAAEYLPDAVQ